MQDRDDRRYARQELLPAIGAAGQARLGAASVLVVGVGALGSHAAEALARAGVGRLLLLDRDVVEPSNLHRQALFREADAASSRPKAAAAAERLGEINSQVRAVPLVDDLRAASVPRVVEAAAPFDVILDGTDNFATRYLLNDLAVSRSTPLVYGGAVATAGTTMAIVPGRTPCLRCLEPEPPAPGSTPTCDTAGVLGPAAGAIAHLQAAQTIRLIVERPAGAAGRLISIDVWEGRARASDASLARDPGCPCCAGGRFEFLDGRDAADASTLCGRDSVQIHPSAPADELDLEALADRLEPHGGVRRNPLAIRARLDAERGDTDEPIEITVFADGRAIVHHTSREDRARAMYTRYVGA